MVMNGLAIRSGVLSPIVPATRKTMIRAPLAFTASRREPGPESFRFVTSITLPPLPPVVCAPNPAAPGKAGISSGFTVGLGWGWVAVRVSVWVEVI